MSVLSRLWRMVRGQSAGPEAPPVEVADLEPSIPDIAPDTHQGPGPAECIDSTACADSAELDLALDDIFSDTRSADRPPVAPQSGPSLADQNAIRQLFSDIAANYSRPIKDFIFELREGSARAEWIEICRPVIGSITDAAESMELDGLVKCLGELDDALGTAQKSMDITEAGRERILELYDKLVRMQPDAFTIDEASRRRESILIDSLLRQIPNVGYVTIEKLYRIGLTSREELFMAKADELSVTSGIPMDRARHVCEWLQRYKSNMENASPEELRARHQMRLIQLIEQFRKHHEAFKRTSDEVSVDPGLADKKREARNLRESCALEIEVILAEMGEIELVQQIQRLAYGKRIKELETYMASMPGPAATTPPVKSVDNASQPVG